MSGGPWEDYAQPRAAPVESGPWLDFAKPAAEKPSVVADVAKGFGSGLLKGAAETAGFLPSMAQHGMRYAVAAGDYLRQKAGLPPNDPRAMAELDQPMPATTEFNKQLTERVVGAPYQPKTTAGEYAHTIGEFTPGAILGPEGAAARVASVVVPAIASETAGQATKGTAAEPWARAGAALAAGGAQAYAALPSQAERAAQRSILNLGPAERNQVLDRAQALLNDAHTNGIPLSTANAIDAASNGVTGLSDLQRHVEALGRMKPFYATMPDAVERAGRAHFDTIAPVTPTPGMIGPQAGEAADRVISGVQAGINAETRPLYAAAEQARIGQPVQAALAADPLYAQTLAEIRNNPALNRTIANLPDDSVAVQDLVQRRLREQAENARIPGQATSSNLAAANMEDARAPVVAAAEAATGSRAATAEAPVVVGSYEAARATQAQLRADQLEPLMNGPLGRIINGNRETGAAVKAIFDAAPNGEGAVADALQRLGQVNPLVARQLVRYHAESIFNAATKNLQSGPNQMGGAKFVAALRGNSQDAANLDAAIRALPDGDVIANGFNRFLDVLEASGRRQNVGSRTVYNAEDLVRLKQGGMIEKTGAALATGGLKLPSKIMGRIEEWRLGRNVDQLARLFSEPDAIGAFRALSNGRGDASGPIGRLVAIAGRQSAAPLQAPNEPR